MAKKFFYVCGGLLMLAITYHLVVGTASAQAPSNPVVASIPNATTVVTANGDVYSVTSNNLSGPWVHMSNVFAGGGPTTSRAQSWGQVKVDHK